MDNTLPQISASKIKTFRQCSRKFYYTYINKPDPINHSEEKNTGALLGTILHRIIEAKYQNPEIDPLALYQEKMLSTLEEWQTLNYTIIGEQYFSKSMKDGREMLMNFNWNKFKPIALEHHFDVPFYNGANIIARVVGYIDLIDENKFVVDHKSQKKTPSVDELANDAQMLLYRYAYNSLYGEYPDKVYWHNLRTGELIDTQVEYAYDTKMLQLSCDIVSMLNSMKNDNAYARINLSDICRKECGFYKLCWSNSIND